MKCKECSSPIESNYQFCSWQCDVINWIKEIKKYDNNKKMENKSFEENNSARNLY